MRLTERLLAHVGGERRLTDLRHLGQSLHAAMVSGQLGVGALVEWLRERIAEARAEHGTRGHPAAGDRRAGRQRADRAPQQGAGVPAGLPARGLGPAVTSERRGRDAAVARPPHPDRTPAGRGTCVLDVGGRSGPGRATGGAAARRRTPARTCGCCTSPPPGPSASWSPGGPPSHNTPGSALHRLLYRSTGDEVSLPAAAYDLDGDPFSRPGPRDRRCGWRRSASGTRSPGTRRRPTPAGCPPAPSTGCWTPSGAGRRTPALTAAAHGMRAGGRPAVGSEPEPAWEDDEIALAGRAVDGLVPAPPPDAGLAAGLADGGPADRRGVRDGGARGARGGRPPAGDLPAELRRAGQAVLAPAARRLVDRRPAGRWPDAGVRRHRSARWPGAARWPTSPRRDRLAELGFELPLAGGDGQPAADVPAGRPGRRCSGEHLPPTTRWRLPGRCWPHPTLAEQTLRGFLTGSIDAVLRVPAPDGDPRYLVVDYKTNWLGPLRRAAADRSATTPRRGWPRR